MDEQNQTMDQQNNLTDVTPTEKAFAHAILEFEKACLIFLSKIFDI
jgi:hypothetical protein